MNMRIEDCISHVKKVKRMKRSIGFVQLLSDMNEQITKAISKLI